MFDTLKLTIFKSQISRIFSWDNLKQPSSVRAYVSFIVSAIGLQVGPEVIDSATSAFILCISAAESIKGLVNFIRTDKKVVPLPWIDHPKQ